VRGRLRGRMTARNTACSPTQDACEIAGVAHCRQLAAPTVSRQLACSGQGRRTLTVGVAPTTTSTGAC
jgi:hypothetical protein